jgi:hypothetical protein
MKTFTTLLSLVLILAASSLSAILYLDAQYNLSALLTVFWVTYTAKMISAIEFQGRKQTVSIK